MRRSLLCYFLFFMMGTSGWCRPESVDAVGIFSRAWELVETRFYDPDLKGVEVDEIRARFLPRVAKAPGDLVKLTNESLGLLKASHTELLSRAEPRYYQLLDVFAHGSPQSEEIRRLFGGRLPHYVGILAVVEEGVVKAVVPGGPSARAGLRGGDVVLSVDGAPFQAIESFRGRAGRKTKMRVKRGDEELMLSVTPEDIQPREAFLRSIEESAEVWELPPYRVGYVRMWSYAGEAYQEKLKQVLLGKLRDTDGLVLDLRGSWGGASPHFAELFRSQTDLTLKRRKDDPATLKSEHYGEPLMLVSDETVSSGKELLAYNLQRSGRAKLAGTPTRGAVLGGALHLLPDGHALYLAQADVLVGGERLEGIGVFPDYEAFPEPGQEFDDSLRQARGRLLEQLIQRDLQRRWHIDQLPWPEKQAKNLDVKNQAWLRKLLENHGWPSRELYGRWAQTAWLIAQHADNDLEFQKWALNLLRKAVEQSRAPAKERAYLEDRVLINQGLPQIYGTQIEKKDGRIVPRALRDPEGVEERRKSVGLPPLGEYLEGRFE